MNEKHDLKLTVGALKWLKEEKGIDVMSNKGFELTDPDVAASIYYAGHQHLDTPPTIEEVEKKFEIFELYEAITDYLNKRGADVAGKSQKTPVKKAGVKKGKPRVKRATIKR